MIILYSWTISKTNWARSLAGQQPMRRISFRSGTLTQASIWCCIIGSPATGNNGFGTSNDNGRNRVPEIYNDSLNGLKKDQLSYYDNHNTEKHENMNNMKYT